jgi:hypothetical protein
LVKGEIYDDAYFPKIRSPFRYQNTDPYLFHPPLFFVQKAGSPSGNLSARAAKLNQQRDAPKSLLPHRSSSLGKRCGLMTKKLIFRCNIHEKVTFFPFFYQKRFS